MDVDEHVWKFNWKAYDYPHFSWLFYSLSLFSISMIKMRCRNWWTLGWGMTILSTPFIRWKFNLLNILVTINSLGLLDVHQLENAFIWCHCCSWHNLQMHALKRMLIWGRVWDLLWLLWWLYRPQQVNGTPVPSMKMTVVSYSLQINRSSCKKWRVVTCWYVVCHIAFAISTLCSLYIYWCDVVCIFVMYSL